MILADSRTFGPQANLCTFDLSDPLSVVTDRPPPPPFLDRSIRHDIDLITA